MKKLKNVACKEKFVQIAFAVMIILAGLYFVLGECILPSERGNEQYECKIFDARWERVFSDGSREVIAIPGQYEADPGGRMQLETVLPDAGSHSYLMFWSQRQDVEIYIDGELRQSYSTEDSRLFGKSSPAQYVFVKLEKEDAGKTLQLFTQGVPGYSGTGVLRTMYIGDRFSIWLQMIQTNGLEVAIGFLVLLFGVACVMFGVALRMLHRQNSHLGHLGWGVIIASVWIITNSSMRQLLFRNVSVANDLAFIAVMIMPMPFLSYLNFMQQRRYRILYELLEGLTVLNFTVCVILQVNEVKDFSASFIWTALNCVLAIISIIATMIIDLIKRRIKEYALLAIGFLGVGVSAVAQIYMYLQKTETPFSGSLIAIGLLFLLIISLIDTIRDVLKMAEEKQQAVYASESKARFLAHMSHEIRTPINAILGMDEIILTESKEEEIRNHAKDIQSASTTLLSLVNEILDFSKIDSGKMEIVPVEYEIAALMRNAYNMIEMRAKDKGLQLNFKCSNTMPGRLFGDEVRIRQIFMNLLTNAVKYTPKGSVTVQVNWRPAEEGKIRLRLAVTDTGIGIKEENLGKLFDSFERIDEKKNRNIEGTGLGLNITKGLVELMGGAIQVRSIYGEGSTFMVEIPQGVVSAEPVGSQSFGMPENLERTGEEVQENASSEEEKNDFVAPEGKILVVDDVPMNLKVITGLLKATKLQIDTAISGMECLQKVKEKKYHLIFLDHMMPEMDGIETMRNMEKLSENKNRETPVVMLTANAIVGAKEEYLQEGFDDYLSKPVDSSRLKKMVKRYLPAEVLLTQEQEDKADREQKPFLERAAFLNTANGMIYSGGSEELYIEIVKMFVETDKQPELEQLFEKEDWKNYQIQVHGLKGTSRSIGADAFSALAKDVEQAVRTGQIEFARSHHEELLSEYRKLMEQLKELF